MNSESRIGDNKAPLGTPDFGENKVEKELRIEA